MSTKNTKNTKNMTKHLKRSHRARKTREHIKKLGIETGINRLTLFRSNQHIYAQILSPIGGQVLASASSLDKAIREQSENSAKSSAEDKSGKIGLSKKVGQLIAERAKAAGIESVACDRSGFKYHGRIAALVEAAREHGLTV